MKRLLLIPYLKWMFFCVLFAWWAFVTVCIVTSTGFGEVDIRDCDGSGGDASCRLLNATLGTVLGTDPPICIDDPDCALTYKELQLDSELRYGMLYHLYGLFWSADVIIFAGQMVIAVAVSMWYFQSERSATGGAIPAVARNSPVGKGLQCAFVTHFGTVVYGAAIIALVQLARAILAYIQKKLGGKEGSKKNTFVKSVLCMCACCLCCMERCLKFVSSTAFIVTAVQGSGFCKSCGEAWDLLTRNALRIGTLAFIGDSAVIIGKLFIAALTTMVSYYLMAETNIKYLDTPTAQPLIPAILIFLASWVIGSLFMQVYSQTINTLMLCYIMDEEMHNGQAQHASRGLHKHWKEYGGAKTRNPTDVHAVQQQGHGHGNVRAETQTSITAM